MTPEEYRDMLYAQIEADIKRQFNMPPPTMESFTRDVHSLVVEKCAEHGNPANIDVEVQYDSDAKAAEIIVTEHLPVTTVFGEIVIDWSKED